MAVTVDRICRKVCSSAPFPALNSFTDASAEPVARNFPSADQATAVTDWSCSFFRYTLPPLTVLLTAKVRYSDPIASDRPSPEIARQDTHSSLLQRQLSTAGPFR